jgi:hypothetical protein
VGIKGFGRRFHHCRRSDSGIAVSSCFQYSCIATKGDVTASLNIRIRHDPDIEDFTAVSVVSELVNCSPLASTFLTAVAVYTVFTAAGMKGIVSGKLAEATQDRPPFAQVY